MLSLSPVSITKEIDWAELWHQQLQKATFKGDGPDFWNYWAQSVSTKYSFSKYTKEVLRRLKLSDDWTVLDVGAGMGTLTLPLAKQVRSVTALDQSEAMLNIIRKKAEAENVGNISLLNRDWIGCQPGIDFEAHDVVLVSRSLPSGDDIASSIKTIDCSAKHACYITWMVANHNDIGADLCRLLNIDYNPLPEYTVLYNLIYSLGICANIEIFRTAGKRCYATLDEAYIQIVRGYDVQEMQVRKKIMNFLADRLYHRDGYYTEETEKQWALIWWQK
jgi:SAM-dependent methyltransferase